MERVIKRIVLGNSGFWVRFLYKFFNTALAGLNLEVIRDTIKDNKSYSAPCLENGVYVGCGAKSIGQVHVGRNARIGAN